MSRWDYEPAPDQEWSVFNRIPLRQCTLFSGEGGAGKSLTQLHLSVATVLERDWLGAVPEQGRALFVDAEDDEKVLHFRLKAIAAHYDTDITTMIERGLHLVSWVGCDSTLATVSRNGKIEPTPLYRQLLEAAGDIKPRMIGIAAAANVFAGNESDRSSVQQFVGLLTRVAMVANGSVVLISHPSLTGISSESGLSGSTQWHNSVRARSFLRGIKPEAGEPVNNDLREIVFKKNNYGPVSESIKLHWDSGLFLPVAGEELDLVTREEIARDVFMSLLKRFHSANRSLSDKPSVSYAPSVFAAEDEAKQAGLTKKNLASAMAQLFKADLIWNEECGRATRSGFRLAPKK
jgi:RecA-family ATPase